LGAAAQIVGRQQVQRRHLNAEVVAPDQELAELGRARPVPVYRRRAAALFGPAAVAVEDHRHVLGELLGAQPAADTVLVDPVKDSAAEWHFPFSHWSTVAQQGSNVTSSTRPSVHKARHASNFGMRPRTGDENPTLDSVEEEPGAELPDIP